MSRKKGVVQPDHICHRKSSSLTMDIQKTFHMKGGLGDASYSKNSSLQKSVADRVKHITLESMQQLIEEIQPKSIGIADLGCSSGPNTLSNIKELIWAVQKASGQIPPSPAECRVYLNDLPNNDFNTVFQALPGLYRELRGTLPVYVAGCPGTFYSRIFPDDCLHFVYSANSLHWLSKVPPGIYDEKGDSINKKSLYISKRSPAAVAGAYSEQFREDLWVFLRSRSPEVVRGGRMVLIMVGRSRSQLADDGDFNSLLWDLLYHSLTHLSLQGEFDEKMLESYDVHFYAPSKEELENEVRKEGSFKVELIKTMEMDVITNNDNFVGSYGMLVANTVRSIQESMLVHHFHLGETALDSLFFHYGTLIDQRLQFNDHHFKNISIVVVLTKL